jgi:hypothetical protein
LQPRVTWIASLITIIFALACSMIFSAFIMPCTTIYHVCKSNAHLSKRVQSAIWSRIEVLFWSCVQQSWALSSAFFWNSFPQCEVTLWDWINGVTAPDSNLNSRYLNGQCVETRHLLLKCCHQRHAKGRPGVPLASVPRGCHLPEIEPVVDEAKKESGMGRINTLVKRSTHIALQKSHSYPCRKS